MRKAATLTNAGFVDTVHVAISCSGLAGNNRKAVGTVSRVEVISDIAQAIEASWAVDTALVTASVLLHALVHIWRGTLSNVILKHFPIFKLVYSILIACPAEFLFMKYDYVQ